MGSWNATCGVSNLPILEGDKTVIFILEGKHNNMVLVEDGICESNALYEPLLPLYTKYCDYGKFQINSNENETLVLDYIKNQFKEERYVCSKKEFDINDVDNLNEVIEIIKGGYLSKKIGFNKYAPIGYMLVHKDTYDNLMELFISKEEYSFERNRIVESYSYTMEKAERYEKKIRKYLVDSSEYKFKKKIGLQLMIPIEFPYVENLKYLLEKAYLKEINKESEEEIIKLAYFKSII